MLIRNLWKSYVKNCSVAEVPLWFFPVASVTTYALLVGVFSL